jgi:hypothetical protein
VNGARRTFRLIAIVALVVAVIAGVALTVDRLTEPTYRESTPRVPAVPERYALTISPVPIGGTVDGVDISCGARGFDCYALVPRGMYVGLHPIPVKGYIFLGFTDDCAAQGHTQMLGPRTCSAIFRRIDSLTPGATVPPIAKSSVPPERDPPPDAAEQAKRSLQQVLDAYCDAYVTLDPDAMQRTYPTVEMARHERQLDSATYTSARCVFGTPTFTSPDLRAGTAAVFLLSLRVGRVAANGTEDYYEYFTSMNFSRASRRGQWTIVSASYSPVPQPR